MKPRRLARPLAALALLSLPACDPLPPIEWSGEHVELGVEDGLSLCAGSYEYLDRHAGFVGRELGYPQARSTLYWAHPETIDMRCPFGVGGCANNGVAVSSLPAFEHELVHTAITQHDTQSFFEEGAAVAYEPDFYTVEEFPARLDPRTMIDGASPDYPTAGAFTAELLMLHGPEPLRELHRRLPLRAGERRVRRTFEKVYGYSFDEAAERFLEGPRCEVVNFPVRPVMCESPELPWSDGDDARWSYARAPSCDDPDVHGSRDGPRVTSVTLEIPTAGFYRARWSIDEGARAVLASCGGCPWTERVTLRGDGDELVMLDEGQYFLWIRAADPLQRRFGVSLEPFE